VLRSVIASLDAESSTDIALAAPITSRLVHLLKKPKKYDVSQVSYLHSCQDLADSQTIEMLGPWTSLLDVESAKEATASIAKAIPKLQEVSVTAQRTLAGIFIATRDAATPLAHMSTFLARHVYLPFIDILSSPDVLETKLSIDISAQETQALLTDSSQDAITLLTRLVEVSPRIAKDVTSLVEQDESIWEQAKNLSLARALLDSPIPTTLGDSEEALAKTALQAVQKGTSQDRLIGRQVLLLLPNIELVHRMLSTIDLSTFSSALVDLACEMARCGKAELTGSIRHLFQVALQKVARFCSAEGDLEMEDMDLLLNLDTILQLSPDVELAVELVEPVITSIINERLEYPAAVVLAMNLTTRIMLNLKASFVRVHLSALLDSTMITLLSETTSTEEARAPFIGLYSALFYGSTYVSCQPNYVEPLLSLYRGTMSTADRKILDMFQTFESVRKVSIASILQSWSSSGLTGTDRAYDAFTSLDAGKVNNTCASFPLRRGVARKADLESNERIYDPVFVMALYGATMTENTEKGLSGLQWVEIMRCGGLGIIVSALSSRDRDMREYANWLLAKTFSAISVRLLAWVISIPADF
jgi:nucleolar pre-ribosomal-associated protein 1